MEKFLAIDCMNDKKIADKVLKKLEKDALEITGQLPKYDSKNYREHVYGVCIINNNLWIQHAHLLYYAYNQNYMIVLGQEYLDSDKNVKDFKPELMTLKNHYFE